MIVAPVGEKDGVGVPCVAIKQANVSGRTHQQDVILLQLIEVLEQDSGQATRQSLGCWYDDAVHLFKPTGEAFAREDEEVAAGSRYPADDGVLDVMADGSEAHVSPLKQRFGLEDVLPQL